MHDSRVYHDLVESVRNFSPTLADSAYDSLDTYDYVFENAHVLPIIDTNKRRDIIPERLSVNRKIGIDLRRENCSVRMSGTQRTAIITLQWASKPLHTISW